MSWIYIIFIQNNDAGGIAECGFFSFLAIFHIFTIKDYNILLNKINVNHDSNHESYTFIQIIIDIAFDIINCFNIISIFMNKILIIYLVLYIKYAKNFE